MTEIAQAEEKLRELRAKIESDDVDGAKACVTQLKMLMLSFPAGPDAPERCAGVAAETLESAALLSLREGDLAAFARNVSQVRPYYDAASSSSSNNNRARILGLNLMYLLTENRLSEFHAELELLTETEAADPLVTFPIALERQLMVGSYDEVLDAGARAPDPSYDFFLESLNRTVRDSIADCLEVAYKTMSTSDARVMMKFDTIEELTEYVEDCRDDWISENDVLCFQPPAVGNKADDIPSRPLIKQVLSYATELERIV